MVTSNVSHWVRCVCCIACIRGDIVQLNVITCNKSLDISKGEPTVRLLSRNKKIRTASTKARTLDTLVLMDGVFGKCAKRSSQY